MHLGQLVLRNAGRSPLRTSMTVITVAIMLAAFVFPRTLVEAQRRQVLEAANDRVLVLGRRGWRGGLATPVRRGGARDGGRTSGAWLALGGAEAAGQR